MHLQTSGHSPHTLSKGYTKHFGSLLRHWLLHIAAHGCPTTHPSPTVRCHSCPTRCSTTTPNSASSVRVCVLVCVCCMCVLNFSRHYWSACKIVRQVSERERERDSTIRSTTPRNLPYRISDADPAMYVPPPPPSRPAAPLKHPRFSHLYGPWAIDKLSHALLRALSLFVCVSLSLSLLIWFYTTTSHEGFGMLPCVCVCVCASKQLSNK